MTEEQRTKLDEMIELYSRAMRKLSKRYFDAGPKIWPRLDPLIQAALPLSRETDRICDLVLKGEATIEDFKHAVTVWFRKLMDGFKEPG